jgi:hypothetical protein
MTWPTIAELVEAFRQDVATWTPESVDAPTLAGEIFDMLDTLGEIFERTAASESILTDREARLTSIAVEDATPNIQRDMADAARDELQWAIEQLGQEAEYAGHPVVISDRWDAITFAAQLAADLRIGAEHL